MPRTPEHLFKVLSGGKTLTDEIKAKVEKRSNGSLSIYGFMNDFIFKHVKNEEHRAIIKTYHLYHIELDFSNSLRKKFLESGLKKLSNPKVISLFNKELKYFLKDKPKEENEKFSYDGLPIESLNLSKKSERILAFKNIHTVGDLKKTKIKDLLKICETKMNRFREILNLLHTSPAFINI